MNIHKNARLTPLSRERIVRQVRAGRRRKAVGQPPGVCTRPFENGSIGIRREGVARGSRHRSSRPHRLYRRPPQAIVEQVERLRRQRCTGKQIAARAGHLAGHRQPHSQAPRARPNRGSGAGPPVRRYERDTSRRTDPPRHQEARPLQRATGSPRPTGQSHKLRATTASAGSTSMSPSTTPRDSPSPKS